MAEEGFEGYHVPQQSRRDKLRVVVAHNQQHHHHQQTTTLLESSSTPPPPPPPPTTSSTSWYDPSSFIPSDLLTCAAATQQGHHGNFHLNNEPSKPNNTTNLFGSSSAVKQEEQQRSRLMMMGFGVVTAMNNNASSSSSSSPSSNSSSVSLSHHHAYMDPQSSSTLHLNNPSIHVFGNNNNNNNNNPLFLYQPQNLRDFDNHGGYGGGGGGGEIMVFKPEPLSLSLSSHNHNHGSNNNNHNSNNNGNNLPLELNLQRYGAMICGGGGGGGGVIPGLVVNGSGGGSGTSNEVSRSCSSVMVVPQMMGPFTGYASVLKGSRFLKPAQQLLEELCDVGVGVVGAEDKIIVADASLMEPPPTTTSTTTPLMECLNHSHHEDPLLLPDQHAAAVESRKKSRLLTMLDEVYRRYRQYYQQMHAVVTSFEYVSGLTNAAPYASLAIKTMSKHFRCLKNAITDQLQFNNKTHFQLSNRKDDSSRFGNNDRGPYGQRSGFIEHQPVWRPQRGLPERAVTVLRAWLFEHFLHPYPTDTDKLMLAKQTGLSRSQVSNWFINARVRLWKPMVEEIHMLETRQAQKNTQREEHSRNKSSDHLPSDNTTLVSENPSTSAADKFQEAPYKRAMNELPSMAIRTQEQVSLACPGNQQVGIGVSMGSASNNNVSLTLGLHQNHGIGLAEPFPLSAAQRFGLGLETNNEGFVLSGFESQNRHFGRDVIGGQLLHDFVG